MTGNFPTSPILPFGRPRQEQQQYSAPMLPSAPQSLNAPMLPTIDYRKSRSPGIVGADPNASFGLMAPNLNHSRDLQPGETVNQKQSRLEQVAAPGAHYRRAQAAQNAPLPRTGYPGGGTASITLPDGRTVTRLYGGYDNAADQSVYHQSVSGGAPNMTPLPPELSNQYGKSFNGYTPSGVADISARRANYVADQRARADELVPGYSAQRDFQNMAPDLIRNRAEAETGAIKAKGDADRAGVERMGALEKQVADLQGRLEKALAEIAKGSQPNPQLIQAETARQRELRMTQQQQDTAKQRGDQLQQNARDADRTVANAAVNSLTAPPFGLPEGEAIEQVRTSPRMRGNATTRDWAPPADPGTGAPSAPAPAAPAGPAGPRPTTQQGNEMQLKQQIAQKHGGVLNPDGTMTKDGKVYQWQQNEQGQFGFAR